MTKSRHLIRPKWRPTDDQVEIVLRLFPVTRTQDVAEQLGVAPHQVSKLATKLGLRKDPEWLNGPGGGRTDGTRGLGTRFQKGQLPWTAGRKLGSEHGKATQFRPGVKPATWMPVGSLRVASGGYLQIKLSDTGYPPRDWVMFHRHVWQKAHGSVPEGYVVAFRDGRKRLRPEEITPDVLECITKAEHMRRHSFHQYGPDVAAVVQLRGVLTRTINRLLQKGQQ